MNSLSIRRESVDGYPIYVVDNCIGKELIDYYYWEVLKLPFKKSEKDFEGDNYPIFNFEFDANDFIEKYAIGKVAQNLLSYFFPENEFSLFRCYINMCHYGDMEYPHRDCEIGKGDITFLYYINNYWDYTWGGETKFYENGDARLMVMPKPGRSAIFVGEIEHMGSIPTRVCTASRLTLAMKFRTGRTSM